MQIVIDIYEDEYERALKRKELFDEVELTRFEKLLVDGIPLPKAHGRLVDADSDDTYYKFRAYASSSDAFDVLDELITVVPADLEEK